MTNPSKTRIAVGAVALGGAFGAAGLGLVHTGSAHAVGAAASYNGIVNTSGSALPVRAYSAGTTVGVGLPAIGSLAGGTEVHVTCYIKTTSPITGPAQGQAPDPYWDELDAASSPLPKVQAGQMAIVPNANISTNNPIDQTVPPCDTKASSSTHDPGITGPGGTKSIPTLVAQQVNAQSDPVQQGTGAGCSVGNVPLDRGTCGGYTKYVGLIVRYAKEAGVDPRLMMGILQNEASHPHGVGVGVGPGVGDIGAGAYDWATGKQEGPSYGLADMKQATFQEVQAAHRDLFGANQWSELPTNPDLAIHTLAWKLADNAAALPATWPVKYKRDEMLALTWNGGNTTAVAYANDGTFSDGSRLSQDATTKLSWYVTSLDQNWDRADQIVCRSGAFTCSR